MKIEILGTESLGVRGMACLIETKGRTIVIDPGVALGYRRHGLLPHPVQVAVGEEVRRRIVAALAGATDVVVSHFHGDHIPLADANPFQLSLDLVAPHLKRARLWLHRSEGLPRKMQQRRLDIEAVAGHPIQAANGKGDGLLCFSEPVPHGRPGSALGTVMMTRISSGTSVFVHASDIQLLNDEAVRTILEWQPDVVLVAGPPLYRELGEEDIQRAWENALRLARGVTTLILDHHVLRSLDGEAFLESLPKATAHRVLCAADFMGRPRLLLEARRTELYREASVPSDGHQIYAARSERT